MRSTASSVLKGRLLTSAVESNIPQQIYYRKKSNIEMNPDSLVSN